MSKEKKAAPEAERETKAPDPAEDGAQDAQESVSEDGAAVQTEIDDLQKQLEAAKKQSDEYLNMAQRVQADFENFRRRNTAVKCNTKYRIYGNYIGKTDIIRKHNSRKSSYKNTHAYRNTDKLVLCGLRAFFAVCNQSVCFFEYYIHE